MSPEKVSLLQRQRPSDIGGLVGLGIPEYEAKQRTWGSGVGVWSGYSRPKLIDAVPRGLVLVVTETTRPRPSTFLPT
jgi:hypothetical protein